MSEKQAILPPSIPSQLASYSFTDPENLGATTRSFIRTLCDLLVENQQNDHFRSKPACRIY